MNIFVFGTLMYRDVLNALLGSVPEMLHADLPDYRRGRIMVPGREAKGPAIASSVGDAVHGRVLLNISEAQLRIFDLFETAASGYERLCGKVTVESGDEVEAYFYASTDEIERYVSTEDWSEADFEKNHLHMYVNERIPTLLKKWKSEGLLP